MPLDNEAAKKQFDSIRQMYAEKTKTLSALVYGDWGCGKTTLLGTAPKPVLIDSFDPGGVKVLQKQIDSGEVMVREFTNDRSDKPTEYIRWERQFEQDIANGFFEHVGTYCMDSLTMLIQAMLNYLANKSNLPDNIPGPREYLITSKVLTDIVKRMEKQNCHYVMTAHLEIEKDEHLGKILATIRGFRSIKADLPVLFDEKWYLRQISKPSGISHEILTRTNGMFRASSRLAASGNLQPVMNADIAEIIKAAGLPAANKPLLTGGASA